MLITNKTSNISGCLLAGVVGLFGISIALMTLRRGVWIDEFITIAWTTAGTSPREFLHLMITRDVHPILFYGIVYLLQAAGLTDIAQLRFINLLGLPLAFFALAYGIRYKSISLSQALIVWILFASSPLFFDYFAELRCYFLLYAASIATSVLWYVLMRHIEVGEKVSGAMILIWAGCLAIFVNLHYYATIFGGMLTAALLAQLALRHLWSQVLLIACVSLVAAAPALVLGALQVFFSLPKGGQSWINTSPVESIKMIVRMIENATAWNLAAVASAVVMCIFVLEDRRKRLEMRTTVILLGAVALFLGMLVLANAIRPLIWDRYLIAGAGPVTLAVATFAASSGAPVWLPTAVGLFALLLQAQILRSTLGTEERGWLPSAKAVAQLISKCPTTKIFAYPAYALSDIVIRHKINSVSYGYYAKIFHFSYEDLFPGATVVASGPCPSVIWIEHRPIRFFEANPNADAEQLLNEFHLKTIGTAELKRYGWGALVIVRDEPPSKDN